MLFLKKLIRFLAILILLVLLAIGSYFVSLRMGWPKWYSAVIFGIVVLLVFTFFLIRKYLLKKKEKRFIQRIVDLDKSVIKSSPQDVRNHMIEIQRQWQEAIEKLKNSKLKKYGNPLYVFPWYIMMGETDSGKTSALHSSGLLAAGETAHINGVKDTRNCEWWFLENAIILDTAGRYSISLDTERDPQEWHEFLRLLVKYRKNEPINGIIVTVPADRLLEENRDKLKEMGLAIRSKIDEMMHSMGANIPVYLLVTKMDRLQGFVEFAELLEDDKLNQAFGFVNSDLSLDAPEVLKLAKQSLLDRIKSIKDALLYKHNKLSPGSVIFPLEFESLFGCIESFCEGLLEENPYQIPPKFRGIYFSSATRKGDVISTIFKDNSFKRQVRIEKDRGIFLKDFFGRVIINDRWLFSYLPEYIKWKKILTSSTIVGILLLFALAFGLLTMSYQLNLKVFSHYKKTFPESLTFTDSSAANLIMLDQLRKEIKILDEANSDWIIPRFGLIQSLQFEEKLKDKYAEVFKKYFLEPMNRYLFSKVNSVNSGSAAYIGYLLLNIKSIRDALNDKERLGKEGDLNLRREFAEFYKSILPDAKNDIDLKKLSSVFAADYYAFLRWCSDKLYLEELLKDYQNLIANSVINKNVNFKWLTSSKIAGYTDITFADFWKGGYLTSTQTDIYIPAAFTQEGRKNIKTFIGMLLDSINDKYYHEALEEDINNFWQWYEVEFFKDWFRFISEFPDVINRINNLQFWQDYQPIMDTQNNPYFELIKRFYKEYKSLKSDVNIKNPPQWVKEITRLNEINILAQQIVKRKKGSIVASLELKGEKVEEAIQKEINRIVKEDSNNIPRAEALVDYINAIKQIDLSPTQFKSGYKLLVDYFSEKPNSKLSVAFDKYRKFKALMNPQESFETLVVYKLVFGPLNFMMEFATKQAACYIQSQWEEKVLSKVNEADPDVLPSLLFNKNDGLIPKFVKSVIYPFVVNTGNGYFIKNSDYGYHIPFKREFLLLINKNERLVLNVKENYQVKITTLPITVNKDAKVEPYYSVLAINCIDGEKILENYNYKNTLIVKWSPNSCGDTTLKVVFPNQVLTKKYPGKLGFASFLKDFRDGTKTFYASDFKGSGGYLKANNIKWIRLSFIIRGGNNVVKLLHRFTGKIPERIVDCNWSD